jgi:hypothetical protein
MTDLDMSVPAGHDLPEHNSFGTLFCRFKERKGMGSGKKRSEESGRVLGFWEGRFKLRVGLNMECGLQLALRLR